MSVSYLDEIEILKLYSIIEGRAKKYNLGGGPYGVISQPQLEASILRPQQCVFEQEVWPSIHQKAAALAHSFINNHPFQNGNKRIALLSTVAFLRLNGYELSISDDEISELEKIYHASAQVLLDYYSNNEMLFVLYQNLKSIYGLICYLDSDDDEIDWNKQSGVRLVQDVAIDWNNQEIAHFCASRDSDNLQEAAGRVVDNLLELVNFRTHELLTMGVRCLINNDNELTIFVSEELSDLMTSNPEYSHLIAMDLLLGTNLSSCEESLEERFEKIEYHKSISFTSVELPDDREKCLSIMGCIADMRLKHGLSNYRCNISDLGIDANFEVRARPLWINAVEQIASCDMIVDASLQPNNIQLDDAEIEILNKHLKNLIEPLYLQVEAAIVESIRHATDVACFCLDVDLDEIESDEYEIEVIRLFNSFKERRNLRPHECVPSFEDAAGISQPKAEPLWMFLVNACANHLNVDEMASWLEEHTTAM